MKYVYCIAGFLVSILCAFASSFWLTQIWNTHVTLLLGTKSVTYETIFALYVCGLFIIESFDKSPAPEITSELFEKGISFELYRATMITVAGGISYLIALAY